MYVNDYTVDMGKEGKEAISRLFDMARESGMINVNPTLNYSY